MSNVKQAVVLVGGLGTRLRPLTLTTPKPLVPVANRPLLAHILRWLEAAGVEEVILATQYAAAAFAPFLRGWRGVATQAITEASPLGTAGAVANVRHLLRGATFVVNGDLLTNLDLRALAALHQQRGSQATIATAEVDDPTGRGVVVCDAAGHVVVFQEKPAPGTALAHTINAGTYVIEPTILDRLAANQPAMWETDLFPALIREGVAIHGAPLPQRWVDVGTPAGYHEATALVLDGLVGTPPGVASRAGLWIDDNVSVSAEAQITGSAALAFGAIVAAGVEISGPAMLGRDVHLLPGAQLHASALWDGTLVERDARIEHCIVGYNCYIGTGAHLMNMVLGDHTIVPAHSLNLLPKP